MNLYWVSLLIQDEVNSKPWLCTISDGCTSFDESMKIIETGRMNYRVLSAWIDTFDENKKKSTVFHECYVNAIGNLTESLKVRKL